MRALDSGGVDYVTKPFHLPELVSRVRTHVALKSARDQLRQLAEDKDELMGILTHDLKNHLSGMLVGARTTNYRPAAKSTRASPAWPTTSHAPATCSPSWRSSSPTRPLTTDSP